MNILLDLLLTFMKIGFFTFGGGYAMIAMMEGICVERKKWITHDEMMNVTVIAESTPGPIAINCATFVGWQQAGFAGALAATFGVVFPSFAVIFAISMFLDNFLEITVIASAFRGIKIAVGILILNAGITMLKKIRISGGGQARSPRKGLFPMAVMACSFAVMLLINIFSWNISTICLMLAAAAVGLAASAAGGFAGSLPGRKGGEKK